MHKIWSTLVCLSSLIMAASDSRAMGVGASEGAPGILIWKGISQGFSISWSTEDLTADRIAGVKTDKFSLLKQFRRGFDQEMVAVRQASETATVNADGRQGSTLSRSCRREARATLLSVVGSLASVREKSLTTCHNEAHPSGETRLLSIDLASKSGAASPIKLTDYFDTRQVFEALRADKRVQKALESGTESPKTLKALIEALSSSPPVIDNEQCYSFPEDLLTRFAFFRSRSHSVEVVLGLPGAGPCRDHLTEIHMHLPSPARLTGALDAAAARKQGYLMTDVGAVSQGHETTLVVASDK